MPNSNTIRDGTRNGTAGLCRPHLLLAVPVALASARIRAALEHL